MNKKEKPILIIKLGALGDLCLALPLLNAYKNHPITWVCSDSYRSLLSSIDPKIHIITTDHPSLLKGSILKKGMLLLKLWFKLKNTYFDTIITAHKDPRYRFISLFLNKKNHFYFDSNHPFPLGPDFHSHAYLKLSNQRAPLIYPNLKNLLKTKKTQKRILLNIYGETQDNKHLRLWPLSYYVKLASLLIQDCDVALIGDEKAKAFESFFEHLPLQNFLGKTTLIELANLMENSMAVVTHDSGILHLARLTSIQICALFGPTSSHHFSLSSAKEFSIKTPKPLKCLPCYDGKLFPSCTHQTCMKTITPMQVYEVLIKRWKLKE